MTNMKTVMRVTVGLTGAVVLATAARADFGLEKLEAGLGYTEVFDDVNQHAVYSVQAGFTPWCGERLEPIVELSLSGKGALFAGAGLAYRFGGESAWGFRVGVVPGYYNKDDGKDLGGNFQILSFGELQYRFENAQAVGLRLAHLSNASTRGQNPGTEILSVTYSIPLK